jgi:hypothetical protein
MRLRASDSRGSVLSDWSIQRETEAGEVEKLAEVVMSTMQAPVFEQPVFTY